MHMRVRARVRARICIGGVRQPLAGACVRQQRRARGWLRGVRRGAGGLRARGATRSPGSPAASLLLGDLAAQLPPDPARRSSRMRSSLAAPPTAAAPAAASVVTAPDARRCCGWASVIMPSQGCAIRGEPGRRWRSPRCCILVALGLRFLAEGPLAERLRRRMCRAGNWHITRWLTRTARWHPRTTSSAPFRPSRTPRITPPKGALAIW
jgi:hypothetical protein